jgi:acetyl-CoA carboxylase biotin carboxyl carrier protein
MDLNLVKKLVKIATSNDISGLEIEENGFRVKIDKEVKTVQTTIAQPQFSTPVMSDHSNNAPITAPAEEKKAVAENLHEIKSPIVGTFYRAPAPDADPYIQVGDTVAAGSVLCIVEAMKLMNEIESDVSGKVVKILVENGKPVEYNQPLFLVQPS